MASETYDYANKAWKATCRVIFGSEIGELEGFREWLLSYDQPKAFHKSNFSGKNVAYPISDYDSRSSFISFDEIDFGRRFEPLGINDIKDIDSIVRAISERFSYAGGVVLGNSNFVEQSSSVVNANYVYGSTFVNDSNYVVYSRYVHFCECCFGFLGTEKSKYIIMGSGSNLSRCFECHMAQELSDCYYCAKARNCADCLFCFGTENRRNLIGNTSLPKEKYLLLKSKLLSEISQMLKKDKRIFSLLDIIALASEEKNNSSPASASGSKKEESFRQEALEDAFSKTTQVLFGKSLHGLPDYAKFLQRHVPSNEVLDSAISGKRTIVCGYRAHLLSKYGINQRIATEGELLKIGMAELSALSLEKIRVDAVALARLLGPIAYINFEKDVGTNQNVKDSAVVFESSDCLHCSAAIRSRKCAYSFWPSESENIFGGYAVFNSSFTMNVHDSTSVTRGFELDECRSCSDICFSHNCENVRDSMFCFNAKNLAYAVGNAPLPPADYRRIKSNITAQLAGELERTKALKWGIFNIGARPGK